MLKSFILLSIFISSAWAGYPGNVCKDNQVNKITICHNGNHQNQGNAELNFVNVCVDFAAVWGHFQSDLLDTVGECGSDLKEGVTYACNAGLKHPEPTDVICIQHDNDKLITDNCNGSRNCVCSSYDGLASLDFMSFSGADFNDFEELTGPMSYVMEHKVAGIDDYVLATNSPENFVLKSGTLSFNLGSERFGSQYFVDMCWQNQNTNAAGEFDFNWKNRVKQNVFTGENYADAASVYTKTDVLCSDVNGNNLEVYSYGTERPFFNGNSQGAEFVSEAKFCTVRHYFNEKSTDFRNWDLKKVTIESELDVTLADGQAPSNGIDICHVVTINNDEHVSNGQGQGQGQNSSASTEVYECNMHFNNSDEFRHFILEHPIAGSVQPNAVDDPKSFKQRHNKDYRGQCNNPSSVATCIEKIKYFEPNIHDENNLRRILR